MTKYINLTKEEKDKVTPELRKFFEEKGNWIDKEIWKAIVESYKLAQRREIEFLKKINIMSYKDCEQNHKQNIFFVKGYDEAFKIIRLLQKQRIDKLKFESELR